MILFSIVGEDFRCCSKFES